MAQKKVRCQMRNTLKGLYHMGKGVSRKEIKDAHNWTPFIHSQATFDTYMKECNKFADYCQSIGYRHIDECVDDVVYDYINGLISAGKQPHTISTALNGIAKGLNRRAESFDIALPKRERSGIVRSRNEVEYDKHINLENHKDLVTFQRCFGLRKDKELAVISIRNIEDDGKDLFCTVKGKGGKIRTVKAYGSEAEKNQIREYLKTRPEGSKLFPDIPKAFDAHAIRAEFASRVYHAHERDLDTLERKDVYICRKDKAGVRYDREALKETSRMLGHNRADVVVNNYSHKF